MKKSIIILGIYLAFLNNVKAQSLKTDSLKSNKSNHFAVGYNVNNFGHDFGLGLNLTSPCFLYRDVAIAIRASENYQLYSYVDKTGNNNWSSYHNIRMGLVVGSFMQNKFIRLYGEVGATLIIGNNNLTSKSPTVGGYGLFGFEFYLGKRFSYFIELGGIGSGANAGKFPASLIYSTVFLSSVGLRIHL